MLVYDRHVPSDVGDGADVVVLLHGRGSYRGDLQALAPHLPPHAALVTPQAPHPAGPWGYGPGWAWYRYLEEDRVEERSLAVALDALGGFLAELPGVMGFEPGRVVLGGFSQGGTTGLAYALSRPGATHAAINFSGFLADSPLVPLDEAHARGLSLFWGHGLRDTNIPHALAERGRARLKEAGALVEARDYPIGHWIAPDEIRDAVAATLD